MLQKQEHVPRASQNLSCESELKKPKRQEVDHVLDAWAELYCGFKWSAVSVDRSPKLFK